MNSCCQYIPLSIDKITQKRKEFLNHHVLALLPVQRKLFVEFLPAFLKEQLDLELLNESLFHPQLKQHLMNIIHENKMLKQDSNEIFDLLNSTLAVHRRSLEKEEEELSVDNFAMTKALSKDNFTLTEEHRIKFEADNVSFINSEAQIQKAFCAITWLYQEDKEFEILLINALAKNKIDLQIYNQMLTNPLNQLRFLASILSIIEDNTLERFEKLIRAHSKKVKVTFNEVCSNALSFLTAESFSFEERSLRIPSSYLQCAPKVTDPPCFHKILFSNHSFSEMRELYRSSLLSLD